MSSCAVVSNSFSWEPKTLHEKVEWCYIRILISVKRLNFERELFLVISSCKYHFNLLLDLSFKSLTDLFLWICCLKATSRLEEHLINCCELWKSVSDLGTFFFTFFSGLQEYKRRLFELLKHLLKSQDSATGMIWVLSINI